MFVFSGVFFNGRRGGGDFISSLSLTRVDALAGEANGAALCATELVAVCFGFRTLDPVFVFVREFLGSALLVETLCIAGFELSPWTLIGTILLGAGFTAGRAFVGG